MGRDKGRLRVGGRTLLAHIRAAARGAGLRVRVLRRDAVPRCGPLGGVFTALNDAGADVLVFLSCDLPFVDPRQLVRVARNARRCGATFFVDGSGMVGFPFALRRELLPVVAAQIQRRRLSLQELARATRAQRLPIPRGAAWQWSNINTPADLTTARRLFRQRMQTPLVSATKLVIVGA
jgi:molybdopterin-guanine dinucleotide biosynthesis protein A